MRRNSPEGIFLLPNKKGHPFAANERRGDFCWCEGDLLKNRFAGKRKTQKS